MIARIDRFLPARSPARTVALAIALVAVIGAIDRLTGHEPSFSIFHLVPPRRPPWRSRDPRLPRRRRLQDRQRHARARGRRPGPAHRGRDDRRPRAGIGRRRAPRGDEFAAPQPEIDEALRAAAAVMYQVQRWSKNKNDVAFVEYRPGTARSA